MDCDNSYAIQHANIYIDTFLLGVDVEVINRDFYFGLFHGDVVEPAATYVGNITLQALMS